MTDHDRERFGIALGALAEVFAESVSAGRARGYWLALEDLDIGQVERGIADTMRTCRFWPKPAEIRDAALGSEDDQAALAWARLLRAVSHVGTYHSVDFGDPVLHACIGDMGGWARLWELERLEARELGYRRAEFVRLYAAYQRRGLPAPAPPALLGQHALANREGHGHWTHGFQHRDPVITLDPAGRPVPLALAAPPRALEPGMTPTP